MGKFIIILEDTEDGNVSIQVHSDNPEDFSVASPANSATVTAFEAVRGILSEDKETEE